MTSTDNHLEEPLLNDEARRTEKSKENDKTGQTVSRNVYITYGMLFFWGLADSIWAGAILSAWLFLLAGGDPDPENRLGIKNLVSGLSLSSFPTMLAGSSGKEVSFAITNESAHANTVVGGVEALQGLATLFTALPIGYLADKYGRAPMCKIGGFGFILSAALTFVAIVGDWDESMEIILLGIALVMWGTFGGVFSGPSQALFAESVPKGQRSYYYTMLQVCYMAPSVAGPVLAIVLFQKYGDKWTFSELKIPFLVGVSLEVPAALFSFFLSDSYALDEEDEEEKKSNVGDTETGEDEVAPSKKQSYTVPLLGITLKRSSIPLILFISDLFYALGSGMTIKFFPLFFMKEVGLSPSQVQGVAIAATVLLMSFSFLAQRLSTKLGRVQVIILCRTSGIILLILLSQLVNGGVTNWLIIIPIYLVRTAAMNCAYPLDESILMDNVKKSERSRWKSLESVSMFGWCGSALFGGYLADKYSYDMSFLITAIMQASGSLMYAFLVPLVVDEAPVAPPSANKDDLAKRSSVLLSTEEQVVGSPRMNISEIEEELVRPLQQSP